MERRKIILIVVPPLIYVSLVYAVIRLFGYGLAYLLIAYFIPPAGKESVVPLMITYLNDHLLSVIVSVTLITSTDAFTAFYIIWNFDMVIAIPKIGEIIKRVESKAREFIERYDLARNTYLGLFFFVFIPFQGTGSTTASVIGRLLGLDNLKLFITIVSASFTSSLFIAIVTVYLSRYFKNFLIVLGVVVILALLVGSIEKYRVYGRIVHETQRRVRKNFNGVGSRLRINRDEENSGKR